MDKSQGWFWVGWVEGGLLVNALLLSNQGKLCCEWETFIWLLKHVLHLWRLNKELWDTGTAPTQKLQYNTLTLRTWTRLCCTNSRICKAPLLTHETFIWLYFYFPERASSENDKICWLLGYCSQHFMFGKSTIQYIRLFDLAKWIKNIYFMDPVYIALFQHF